MRKKITDKQLKRLFEFTKQHYVEYYDLQLELVDHLAIAIEKQWEKTPEMNFENCINLVFKKFGVFGFMDVVQERRNALTKKYWNLIWKEFIQFLRIPKLLLILSGTILTYTLLQSITFPEWFFLGLFAFIFSILLTQTLILSNRYKKKVKKTGRKWLLEEMIFKIGNLPLILNIIFQLFIQLFINKLEIKFQNPYLILLESFVFVTTGLVLYIAFVHLPKNVEKILIKTHPEYNLEKI